jgi:thiol:disulfide interchange protein DsbA
MRLKSLIVLAASLACFNVFASPTDPQHGGEYVVLATPQPVQSTGSQVEVVEFFMYHCPACNALEPSVQEWSKHQGADKVLFRRFHIPHAPKDDPEAHLFLTLEAMKNENALHAKVMQTWHVEHRRLKDDAANIDWATSNGIDKAAFMETYTSFGVKTKLASLGRVTSSYQVDSTPTFVIAGKYITNPSMIYAANKGLTHEALNQATFQVIDALVAKARAEK